MGWVFLIAAILFEVCGTAFIKLSQGFTRLLPSLAMLFFYALSLVALTAAIKKIEVSVAYAIWSGLGTALVATVGIVYFQESASLLKMVSLGLILAGVIALNLAGAH